MLIALFVRLHLALAGMISTAPPRLRSARGVTFIEYALLAAIAVFIGWLFRTTLTAAFTGLLDSVRDALNTDRAGR